MSLTPDETQLKTVKFDQKKKFRVYRDKRMEKEQESDTTPRRANINVTVVPPKKRK